MKAETKSTYSVQAGCTSEDALRTIMAQALVLEAWPKLERQSGKDTLSSKGTASFKTGHFGGEKESLDELCVEIVLTARVAGLLGGRRLSLMGDVVDQEVSRLLSCGQLQLEEGTPELIEGPEGMIELGEKLMDLSVQIKIWFDTSKTRAVLADREENPFELL